MLKQRGAIAVTALRKQYSGSAAVDGVDLTVEAGEFVAILGPSGCGKSTVLGMVGGFVRPDSGDVAVDGRSIIADPPERRPTAMVFQGLALFPHLTVEKNIAFGLRAHRRPRVSANKRARELLELVRLEEFAQRRVSSLSGGQRQRVAIARALAVEPAVLLLDEPLSALDAQLRVAMQRELRELQRRTGNTFLYVTHDQNEAMSMADRIVIMRNGKVEQIGTPKEIYDRPHTDFVARFLGEANIVDGSAGPARESHLAKLLHSTVPATANRWAIRPEHVRFTDQIGDGTIAATITGLTFYGPFVRYEVDAHHGSPFTVTRPTDEPLRAFGENVLLRIDTSRVTAVRGAA